MSHRYWTFSVKTIDQSDSYSVGGSLTMNIIITWISAPKTPKISLPPYINHAMGKVECTWCTPIENHLSTLLTMNLCWKLDKTPSDTRSDQ